MITAIDLTNQAFIEPTEFSFSGVNPEAGGATQMHVDQLLSALGTRQAADPSGDGIRIRGSDTALLRPSTILRNTITDNQGTCGPALRSR